MNGKKTKEFWVWSTLRVVLQAEKSESLWGWFAVRVLQVIAALMALALVGLLGLVTFVFVSPETANTYSPGLVITDKEAAAMWKAEYPNDGPFSVFYTHSDTSCVVRVFRDGTGIQLEAYAKKDGYAAREILTIRMSAPDKIQNSSEVTRSTLDGTAFSRSAEWKALGQSAHNRPITGWYETSKCRLVGNLQHVPLSDRNKALIRDGINLF